MEEKAFIEICKTELSQQFHLPKRLMERDFEFLNQKILEEAKVDISTATLRRIWANRHQGTPQTKTLDALADTLGYKGWHEFKIKHKASAPSKVRVHKKVYLWLLTIPFLLGFVWNYTQTDQRSVNQAVIFEAEKELHEGVPATIGFKYDIEGVNRPVSIQLSWNPYERAVLDPKKHFYTGTYFYPDYHEAKLQLGEEVLASRRIHITTSDWHGLIMRAGYDANPVFIDEGDFLLKQDQMTIRQQTALAYHVVQSEPYYPVFTLSNNALDSLSADKIHLTMDLQLFPSEQHLNCRSIDVLVKGTHGNIRIPVSEQGCYGLYQLKVGSKTLSGKTFDLSGLTTDLTAAVPLEIQTAGRVLTVKLDQNNALAIDYPNKLGPVKVLKVILTGPGSASAIRFMENNQSLQ